MNNVASDSEYEQIRADLNSRLMSVLREQDDPRLTESPPRFELPPFAGPVSEELLEADARWVASREQDASMYATVTSNRAKRI